MDFQILLGYNHCSLKMFRMLLVSNISFNQICNKYYSISLIPCECLTKICNFEIFTPKSFQTHAFRKLGENCIESYYVCKFALDANGLSLLTTCELKANLPDTTQVEKVFVDNLQPQRFLFIERLFPCFTKIACRWFSFWLCESCIFIKLTLSNSCDSITSC